MIVAYLIEPCDDDTNMLGDETYTPPRRLGFHDWRFGKDGVAHPATCATCGRKIDPAYINPEFRVGKRRRDLSATLDGYTIVSSRFRQFCQTQRWQGVKFVPLPADKDFFVMRLSKVLAIDTERSETRLENRCPICKQFCDITGGTPCLRRITEPIEQGLFRSDLEFASGPEQSPLIFAGVGTAKKLKEQKFQKYAWEAIHA